MNARRVFLREQRHRDHAKRLIDQSAPDDVMTITKKTRSLAQNAKLHPMLADIQRQVPGFEGFALDDIKLRFLNALGVEMRFLPALEGEGVFPVGLRSSTLTVQQFAGLINLLYEFGGRHDVRWSEPVERIAA